MGAWGVVRRLGVDHLTTAASLLAVVLSLTVVATGPIYAEAVTIAALRGRLADEPLRASTITIESTTPEGGYESLDALVTSRLRRATSSTGAELIRRVASESYEYGAASDELVALAVIHAVEGLEQHVTVARGAWPAAGDTAVAVDDRTARELDLDIGDQISLTARRDPDAALRLSIGGIYEIDDPDDTYWTAAPMLADRFTESTRFRTWGFAAPTATVLAGTTPRVDVAWFARPDLSNARVTDIDLLRRRTSRLEDDLGADLGRPIEVDTGLPEALRDADRALTVTRSSVFAVTLQLAVVAGYALALTAGLVAESRRRELDLLRARGAGPLQLLRRSTAEALVLTVPAALLAPHLAAAVTGIVGEIGPLARTDLAIDPRPLPSAHLAVAIAAMATIILLAVPTFRLARAAQRTADGQRDRPRSTVQRAGIDIAVAVLTAVTIWQLATLDEDRTAEIRGRFGVDPLLVIAPALGLFAGAFLALRVVPGIARLLERAVVSTRSAVPALAGWQVARRPTRYARVALLLMMGVALGVFTTTYESTWEQSQHDQATHQAGARVRVEPDRRVDAPIEDLHLATAYRQVDGVRSVAPGIRRAVELPNTDRPARLVAIDARHAGDAVLPASRDLRAAFDRLVAGRPSTRSLPLPGEATAIELELLATDAAPVGRSGDEGGGGGGGDDDGDGDDPAAIDALAFVVVRDGDGLLHRRRAGQVVADGRPTRLTVELEVDDPLTLAPAGPLDLVDIELRTGVPADRNHTVRIEVVGLDAVDADGDRRELAAAGWSLATSVVGSLDEPVAIEQVASSTPGLVNLDIRTGRSRFGAFATYGIRPAGRSAPRSYPVIVSRAWFDANNREIGDSIALGGVSGRTARIAGTVDAFPTVDPRDAHVVLVDLPTLHAVAYELGQPISEIGEVWLATDADVPGVADRLRRAPYDAASVIVRDDLADALLADPPAVGTIGVLTVGFVAASAFAVIGVLVAATVSARDRASEFALLRALGLSARQLAASTLVEQAALILVSLALGTSIGLLLAALVLPEVSLTSSGSGAFPPVEVVRPWAEIVVVQVVVLVALVAAVVGISVVLRRQAIARQLRSGSP